MRPLSDIGPASGVKTAPRGSLTTTTVPLSLKGLITTLVESLVLYLLQFGRELSQQRGPYLRPVRALDGGEGDRWYGEQAPASGLVP